MSERKKKKKKKKKKKRKEQPRFFLLFSPSSLFLFQNKKTHVSRLLLLLSVAVSVDGLAA